MTTKEQALEILDRFEFFQGQRAGRELWSDKPVDVQERDIADFSRDVALLKEYISAADVAPRAEWISVEERLPLGANKGEMPENIIAYTSNGEVATGWLNVETWYLLYGDNDEHYRHGIGYVTHWMHLPEPPDMKGGE
jgi:hypothetical protein